MHGIEKRIVYVLRSESNRERRYVGITNDLKERLKWHNGGPSGYTTSYRPWSLLVSVEFSDERTALRFERYLKSGSGRAFANRHFSSA
jgi:putative endonuclease